MTTNPPLTGSRYLRNADDQIADSALVDAMLPRLMGSLAQFARAIASGWDIIDVLHHLTEQVTAVLGCDGAGVSLLRDGELHFVTCDADRLSALEQLQRSVRGRDAEGPCVEAARTGEPVRIARLGDHAGRWSRYVELADTLGIAAVLAAPLRADVTLGTLELYDADPHEWTDEELAATRLFADITAGHLRHASALEEQRRSAEQLQHALNSRVVIEQAKGIVAAQRNLSVDGAFQVLRTYANKRGATLRAVAEAVVKLGLRP
jgi:GAF domain-containing protein